MTEIAFTLHLDETPTTTHQQKKVSFKAGRAIFYEGSKLKATRALLTKETAKYRPKEPINNACELYTQWRFKRPKNRKKEHWKTTRPDTDNLNKLLKDVLTDNNFWRDDSLVVREIIEKVYSDDVGIEIRIKLL